MKQTFYSNGKLLITGEYVVLDGAKALALPTKFGQNLVVNEGKNNAISWKSYDSDGSVWFESIISFDSILAKEDFVADKIKTTLVEILHHTYLLNPSFITQSNGYEITTELTFPKFWGLGTSSTLINNIAQWQQIDAFTLLRNSFGGSGYDVACAQNNTPIVYELQNGEPVISTVDFQPTFADKIHFVYLNKKQSSKIAIANYYNKQANIQGAIPVINAITKTIITSAEPKEFANALQQHEIELSAILEMETVKEALFPDFKGTIKSLGAWGGDFILVIAKENPTAYFKERGYSIVIPYTEMIL
ncbi:GHMP kinase [Flavobacterium amnicola]|uniref:GHMP kinase n=1 Tax=Flavobacterium amnicola TaxID=2506422 RepID=A0A4Q1K5U1_9FLAO|nr:GYDIA family GHMP kinase [Flavobacterium amnicola]RXR21296.1 GHMP kinase [Flavobacterium amnicola]